MQYKFCRMAFKGTLTIISVEWWKITPCLQAKLKLQRHLMFPWSTNTWNSDVKHRKSKCSCSSALLLFNLPSSPGCRTQESINQHSRCLVSHTPCFYWCLFVSFARDVTAPPTQVLVWSLRAVDSRRELVLGGDLTVLSGSGLSLFVCRGVGLCARWVISLNMFT